MEFITDFYLFLSSVLLISLSGVLMPGPLFAVTINKASKSKTAGALIAVGHGIVEFPLMFLIFFVLSQFEIPSSVQVAVGLIGGSMMILMGIRAFMNRHKQEEVKVALKRDSILAGVWTSAANAGFILWWLTIGTALILNAKLFGLAGFSVFAGVHWLTDFLWYAVVGLLIFKSQRFWSNRTRLGITMFCVSVFIGFGAYFMGSALWSLLA
ncbi:MAG TPA: LysE family transporter [Candidatus Deferrimicrobiaceae bacterium]|nr:LysE family transporter [Candidatus Deferrimicrobiaceae bacterium]